nr:MAG: hypothetical protein TU35_03890 [Thermoproteus sp. AZ2]
MGKIAALVELIRRNVGALDELLESRTAESLIGDYVMLNAVLHLLQTAAQALIDLGAHLLAELGGELPRRYADIPKALRELGVLPMHDADLMRRAVGFRNVVHGYAGVSLDIVRAILGERTYRELYRLALAMAKYAAERGIDP